MKSGIKLLLVALSMFCAQGVLAQEGKEDSPQFVTKGSFVEELPELSAEDLENFKDNTNRKVRELQNAISKIGDKASSRDVYMRARKRAVKLFASPETAVIEVSNIDTGDIETILIKDYFPRLRALKYDKVAITFYDVAYLSDFQKGADGKYYATAVIFQEFRGFMGDRLSYTDRTQKRLEVVLDYADCDVCDEVVWEVKLGDIKVDETM